MTKILRTLITLVAALALLGLTALIGLVVFVNPNDFKPQISQAVMKFTGQELQLGGNIRWTIFPWLGLQLNDAQLSNKPEFSNKPLAHIQKLDIQIRLLPLLHKQLEIGRLQADGLTLYLVRNNEGQVNWQKTQTLSTPKTPATYKSILSDRLKPLGFIIAGLDIHNSRIFIEDQQKNKHIEITELQLKSANLTTNKSSPLSIQFNLKTNSPDVQAKFTLLTHIILSADGKNVDLNGLDLTTQLQNANDSKGKLPISLKANIKLNLKDETLTVDKLAILSRYTKLTGHLTGQNLLSNPSLTGTFASQQMKVGRLILQQIQLSFQLKNNKLILDPVAKLYQGNYQGTIQIDFNPAIPVITGKHQFKQINIQPLYAELIHQSQINLTGLATLNFKLATQGNNRANLIKNLQGNGYFNLENGTIKGINLSYWIALGKALIKHNLLPKINSNETPFDKFTGGFTVNRGILHNKDLFIRSGRLRVNGQGSLDLSRQQINYELEAQPILADGSPDGIAIPIKITGPLQNIHITPVIDKLGLAIVKEKMTATWSNALEKLDLKKLFH